MALPQWALPFKEPHTEIKCIKNRYYKYEVSYQYDPNRKRTIKKTGHLLGSITEAAGFIPSSKNTLRKESEKPPKVDIKTYGVYTLFETLLKDEIPTLQKVFGKERAEQLLTFAMFRWAYQSPIKRIANYQAHDFCSEHWCQNTVLSDKEMSAALKSVGENRELVVQWMRSLLPDAASAAEKFVLMDSTHVMSASDNMAINVPGYNPSFDFGKQIRLMYMFSAELKKPVYYRLINGNITDISSMALCVKEMGVQNVVFIADKGFYSEQNIKLLENQKLQYVIPLRRNNSVIDYTSLSQPDFKKATEYFVYQKRIIWHYQYNVNGRQFITFMDERLRVEEEQDYLQRIETQPDLYTKEGYFEKLHRFGTLTLTFKTSTDGSAQQLYQVYKQRNEIEIMFDSYKNFLKADVSYMQNRHVLEGWLFTNFIAMIAYYKLFDRLRNAGLLTKESPKDIIELAKAVYQLRIRGAWNRSEIAKRIQKIFKKINIDTLT
jgi:transposase